MTEENKQNPFGRRLHFELFQKDSLTAVGGPALPFHLRDPNNQFYELKDFKGRYVLIMFWSTWCNRCIRQFASYYQIYHAYEDEPLDIVGISVDSDYQSWISFLKAWDLPWLNLLDEEDEDGWQLFDYYDIGRVPSNVLIGKEGEIVKLNVSFQELEEILIK